MAQNENDYFSDSSGESAEKPSSKEKNDSAQTALLPKSFFPEKSLGVGKECKIKQVAIMEDEVEVKYVAHDKKAPEEKMPMRESEMEDDYV